MKGANQDSSTPYCRCRVLYLGSSVPHASKEGLLGVQEPLRELYPEQGAVGARGIDSWLSVWSNGLLLENVDENRKKVTRFFPIESLHYCAAVRHVKNGAANNQDPTSTRFLPLDSPFASTPSANHPPLFAAVLRRTTGIKVLECHAFICKRDMAANALVRCCFHAYADSRFAKGLDANNTASTVNGSPPVNGSSTPKDNHCAPPPGSLYHTLGGSSTTLDNGGTLIAKLDTASSNDDAGSLYNGDENHKVWAKGRDELDTLYQEQQGTLRSTKGSRPRQLIAPPPPPPPPPPPQQPLMGNGSGPEQDKKSIKGSKKSKKSKNRDLEQQQQQQLMQQQQQLMLYANGHHHTLGHHPMRGHHHPHFHPSSRSVAGTMARPAPVFLVPAATLPRKLYHHPRGIRPVPAPIVPIYAPLPPQAIYGRAVRRTPHPEHQSMIISPAAAMDGSSLGLAPRRLAASHADLTAPNQQQSDQSSQQQQSRNADSPEADSRFDTGIYRRKGHLNERAFSYSIRAEHRSRSHGSLASLGFEGVQQNGNQQQQPTSNGNHHPKEDHKKNNHHQDIGQMVAGLSISNGTSGVTNVQQHHHQHMNGKLSNSNGSNTNNNSYHHHHNHQPQPLPRPRPR